MLTDGRTDGRTDDGRKVITIAHPEQSSGELTKTIKLKKNLISLVVYSYFYVFFFFFFFFLFAEISQILVIYV